MLSLALDMIDENGVPRPAQPVSLPEGNQARPDASSLNASLITKTAGLCCARACIAATRITVWGLVAYRNLGLDERAILAAVPQITSDQLAAAFRYADENADAIMRDIVENENGEGGPGSPRIAGAKR